MVRDIGFQLKLLPDHTASLHHLQVIYAVSVFILRYDPSTSDLYLFVLPAIVRKLCIVLLCLASLPGYASYSLLQDLPIDISERVEFLEDPDHSLEISQVMRMQMQPVPSGKVDFGYSTSTFWLRFSVVNNTPLQQQVVLYFRDIRVGDLSIFVSREDMPGSGSPLLNSDSTTSFSERPISDRKFRVPLSFAPGETQTFHARFNDVYWASLPIELNRADSIASVRQGEDNWFWFFVAVLLTLTLASFFYFVATRQTIFIFYVGLQLSTIAYCVSIESIGFQLLWPNEPEFNRISITLFSGFCQLFLMLFTMSFLGLEAAPRWLTRWFQILLGVVGLHTFSALLVPQQYVVEAGFLINPFTVITVLAYALWLLYRGNVNARYYLLGWSMVFAIVGYLNLAALGLFPAGATTMEATQLFQSAILFEALVFAFGVADRYRRLSRQNEQQQRELVAQLSSRLDEARERSVIEAEKEVAILAVLQNSKLLASTSHDLQQPLTSMNLALDNMLQGMDDRDTKATQLLQASLRDIGDIVSGTLSDASGSLRSLGESATVAIDQLLIDLVMRFSEEAREKELFFRIHSPPINVLVPRAALTRCLSNLVSNAVRHTNDGGILLGARRRGHDLLLQVFDTGIGMSEDERQQAFKLHQKSENSSGYGLGLAIVNEIANEAGWAVSCRSVPGKGSCFSLLLPGVIDE